ncbi:retrograde regulation protein 2 [Basidiobolus ranarum]|uniref:Retrograde regulation protein 2 n=1 Tax=Basidiobolus ranarum TaxID=34480 RepID=A0ABR2X1N6_9FUNG
MSTQTFSPRQRPVAIVDVGSNGIRFCIFSTLARHLPIIYEERSPISLFDAQNPEEINSTSSDKTEPVSISSEVVGDLVRTFKRFQTLCNEAGVEKVRVVATEALRTAPNSQAIQDQINQTTGWKVELLTKEGESRMTALGIMSSFTTVDGFVMDLGGGSVELNYVVKYPDNPPMSSDNAQSLPFGAALLARRLTKCQTQEEHKAIYREILEAMQHSLKEIKVPNEVSGVMRKTLYLSGGGFRALGYLSMMKHKYPISIINGYRISVKELKKTIDEFLSQNSNIATDQLDVFRISNRRAKQIPACCVLLSAALEVLNQVEDVYFSEGGVRQGSYFDLMSSEEQAQDPVISGVKEFITGSFNPPTDQDVLEVYRVVKPLISIQYKDKTSKSIVARCLNDRLVKSAIYLSRYLLKYPKESAANIAFRLPLTGGLLSNLPGLIHDERILLALILSHSYGAELSVPRVEQVQHIVPEPVLKRAKLIGEMLSFLVALCPLEMDLIRNVDLSIVPSSSDDKPSALTLTLPEQSLLVEGSFVEKSLAKIQKKLAKFNSGRFTVHVVRL